MNRRAITKATALLPGCKDPLNKCELYLNYHQKNVENEVFVRNT
jgi:hypothetical protein